jgi:hypothetical protein
MVIAGGLGPRNPIVQTCRVLPCSIFDCLRYDPCRFQLGEAKPWNWTTNSASVFTSPNGKW